MTTPPPGQALTAETVKLLVKGDLLEALETTCAFCRGDVLTFEGPGPMDECMVFGMSWMAKRFAFIGRPDADGWIAWSGGDNPLPGVKVEVRLRDGSGLTASEQGDYSSEQWEWPHYGGDGDIIAYRLASQSTAPTRGEGDVPAEWTGEGTDADFFTPKPNAFNTPPEPVASALAGGERLEVVAWRAVDFQGRERGLFYSEDVARETTASDDTIMALVTAEAAAARIAELVERAEKAERGAALIASGCDKIRINASSEIRQHDDRATQAEARADRLARALEPFSRLLPDGIWRDGDDVECVVQASHLRAAADAFKSEGK